MAVSLLLFVLSCSFTGLYVYDQRQSTRQVLKEKGEILIRLLAYNARLGVFSENSDLLRDPMAGVMREQDVIAVAAFNTDGNLLRKEIRDKSHLMMSDDGKSILERLAPEYPGKPQLIESTESTSTFTFRAPVYSSSDSTFTEPSHLERPSDSQRSPIGAVAIIMDKNAMNISMRRILTKSFITTAFFLFIGLAINWILVNGIARPLRILIGAVTTFDETGRMNEIPIESEDEIGRLAAVFNHLNVSLRQREEEKAELEEQLRHAQKMEAIGTLSGGIAHDFNNLLTTIMGYSDYILGHLPADDPNRSFLEEILGATERATNLTRSLLAFSHKQLLQPQPVNLNDSIIRLKQNLLRLVGEQVDLQVQLSAGEIIIMADPGQLDQVIMNLITNARDAMPDGGVLTITTAVIPTAAEVTPSGTPVPASFSALLTVSDTGVGIPVSIQERIFEPYFTTKDVGKGTGLGLSMVYGIIKQLGGSINLTSELGKGTTFKIQLPLTEAVAGQSSSPREKPSRAYGGGRETILLAEDEVSVRSMTKAILEENGYTIIEAIDGEAAVRKFKENSARINLLLLDMMMPKMNGLQVSEEIQRIAPTVKVLFISGYASDILKARGLTRPNLHFVSKPISVTTLLRAIREALGDPATDERPPTKGEETTPNDSKGAAT